MISSVFRLIPVLIWGMFLLVTILTNNIHAFLQGQTLQFTWIHNPNLHEILRMDDVNLANSDYLLMKTGHLVGFMILGLLLIGAIKNRVPATSIGIGFAVLTEVLQLYFSRDGRLVDIGIDTLGIFLSYFIYHLGLQTSFSITIFQNI